MTRGDTAAGGEPADAVSTPAESSAWAPLGRPVFRLLWLGVLISWIGTWMQTVGAQWQLVDQPNAAALVSLVQVAGTLPMMLLALPGGVLADSFDRRRLLITVQAYLLVVAILLTMLTAAGLMPPALLLAFIFTLGLGAAVQIPAWQAMMPELVPRTQLRAAVAVRDAIRGGVGSECGDKSEKIRSGLSSSRGEAAVEPCLGREAGRGRATTARRLTVKVAAAVSAPAGGQARREG
jgi:hypothetical protein